MAVQPADFGTNLNAWFRLLGRRWKPLLIMSVVVFAPIAVVAIALFFVADLPGVITWLAELDPFEQPTLQEVIDMLTPLIAPMVIVVVLLVLASAFVYLAASRVVACDYAEVETDWRAASRFAVSRLARAIGAQLLVSGCALVMMGLAGALAWWMIVLFDTRFFAVFIVTVLVLTMVPALIWLTVSVSLYNQSIAMADRGVIQSLLESFTLVRQRWWPTLGFVLVTGLIASAGAQVLSIALFPLFIVGIAVPEMLAIAYGVSVAIQGPITAAMAAAYSVWYIDLRARGGTVEPSELVS